MSIPITTTEAELAEFLKAKAATFNIPGLALSFALSFAGRMDETYYAAARLGDTLDVGDTFAEAVGKLGEAKARRTAALKAELAKLEAL